MFADRSNAGVKLVEKLRQIKITDPVVLAVPNGGVEISLPIVECLNCSFDLIILEKLRLPSKPEWSFGAITEDGYTTFNDYEKFVNHEDKIPLINDAKIKIKENVRKHRVNEEKINVEGRNVILVDDGANHGSTLHACINSCKKRKAASVTIALPVLSDKVYYELKPRVNEIVYLEKDNDFKGVSSYYRDYSLNDDLCRKKLDVFIIEIIP